MIRPTFAVQILDRRQHHHQQRHGHDFITVNASAGAGEDNFVFAQNFGQATIPITRPEQTHCKSITRWSPA
jgi:hypothetical protein